MTEKELLQYKVGALMYTPALNTKIGEKIVNRFFPELDSLCLCLEDAITDNGVRNAEDQLIKTLKYIFEHKKEDLPLLFVRVCGAAQFERLSQLLGDLLGILTGVIFPKFDLSNAAEYCSLTGRINAQLKKPLFMMPILESRDVINFESRDHSLIGIRKLLDGCKDLVLNIRVGAMDFCNFYGLRRPINQSIYDIRIVEKVLSDILTVFADDYIVSAPVWEYYDDGSGDKKWLEGLENELRLDNANGFVGKTVIHPSQLPVIRKWLKPLRTDFEDAKAVLDWRGGQLGVMKSCGGNRMNELAVHRKWAQKILHLAEAYGVREL
jgi:citrate lyase beta subunit